MRKFTYLLFAMAIMFTCSQAFAQTSVVMKAFIGTTRITGGSTVQGHVNDIDILSYSKGATKCDGCTQTSFSSFNIMLALNPATITFKKSMVNGTRLTSVDIYYVRGGANPLEYYKMRMENVLVESVQESGSSEVPSFAISLVPDRMAWQQISDNGAKKSYGWDVKNNIEWLYY